MSKTPANDTSEATRSTTGIYKDWTGAQRLVFRPIPTKAVRASGNLDPPKVLIAVAEWHPSSPGFRGPADRPEVLMWTGGELIRLALELTTVSLAQHLRI